MRACVRACVRVCVCVCMCACVCVSTCTFCGQCVVLFESALLPTPLHVYNNYNHICMNIIIILFLGIEDVDQYGGMSQPPTGV